MKNDQQQNSANILGGLDDDTAQNNIDCIVYCQYYCILYTVYTGMLTPVSPN